MQNELNYIEMAESIMSGYCWIHAHHE